MKTLFRNTFLVFLILVSKAFCQGETRVGNFNISSGMSNGFVNSISQDSDGFVWIATEDGLNRFDGHGFRVFNKSNSGLTGNELNCVCPYPGDPNRMLIGTQRDGICVYDKRTGLITPFGRGVINTPDIQNIVATPDGGMLITHYHEGVQYYHPEKNQSRTYDSETVKGMPNLCWTAVGSKDGKLYVGHVFEGFSVVDTVSHTLINYRHDPENQYSLPGDIVYSICIDGNGNVWIGTDRGAALYNSSTGAITRIVHDDRNPYSIAPGRVMDIKQLDNGDIWFATSQGGVSMLDVKSISYGDVNSLKFSHLPANNTPFGTSSAYVKRIFQDSFGNIWLGNFRSGLDVISHLPHFFSRVEYTDQVNARVDYKPVWSCGAKEGVLWFGGENELVKLTGDKVQTIVIPTRPSAKVSYIRSLMVDSKGKVWIGTNERGALIYDPSTGAFHDIANSPNDVRAFYEEADGRVMIGTAFGLYYSDGVKSELIRDLTDMLPDVIVQAVTRDRNGNLWVGTLGKGITVFDTANRKIADLETQNGFVSNAINGFMFDRLGNCWVATRAGLVMFPAGKKFTDYVCYDKISGIGTENVKAVAEDLEGNIWVSTNLGVARLGSSDPHLPVTFYGGKKENPVNSFMENAVAIDDDGNIYFGSMNGIVKFNPRELDRKTVAQPVMLTGFTLFNESGPSTGTELPVADAKEGITLRYNNNSFMLTFDILDYGLKERTAFSYRMRGLDDKWINWGGMDNRVTYRNLPPGNYEFEVRQRQLGYQWEEPIKLLSLRINPPVWATWWAKTLYVLIAIILMAVTAIFYKKRMDLRQRLSNEVAESRNRQQMNEERLRFFTNVTHELRTPLTLILGPLEDLVSDPGLPAKYSYKLQTIRDSSTRLLDLINQILEFRKTETQNRTLSVRIGNLGNLLREIALRFKELNRNQNVSFNIDIQPNTPQIYFDEEMITTIVNNLLANAVKYTPKGVIGVSYHIVKEGDISYVEMKISDTGYGIAKKSLPHIFERYYQANGAHQMSGSGLGLALVKNLVDLHQGTISVESTEGKGTVFTIRLIADNLYPDALHGTEEEQGRTEENDENQESADHRLRILVVEDNDDIRDYISQSLSNDYYVDTASNGLEGLQKAQDGRFDLIISDIMMPEMDGTTMCRMLKNDLMTSHVPIILLTAKDSLLDKEEGYDAGADSYLTKPFSGKLLKIRINNLLQLRKRIAERYMSKPHHIVTMNEDSEEVKVETISPESSEESVTRSLSPLDREFMDKINAIINENLSLEDLGVGVIAEKMCMSHSTLYRKIMAICGVSTNEYVRHIRLSRAAEMLMDEKFTVNDIAWKTGFSSHSSFGKAFKKEYGMSPSEYVKSMKNNYRENIS